MILSLIPLIRPSFWLGSKRLLPRHGDYPPPRDRGIPSANRAVYLPTTEGILLQTPTLVGR